MPHLDASALAADPEGLEVLAEVLASGKPKRLPSWGPKAARPARASAPAAEVVELEIAPGRLPRPAERLRRAG